MQLRRALLLFAVVLGLAAVATSFSRPAKHDGAPGRSPARESTPPASAVAPAQISFSTTAKPRTQLLAANSAATVTVEVARPGQVELAGLGQTAAAEPPTPARFEVLESQAGRYKVRFTPATDTEARTLGTLLIVR